jgi:regulatory protein
MAEQPARRPKRPADRGGPPDREGALEVAARFLATRPRTRWEVDRRLRRAGADKALRTATLDHLARLGFVDDAAFARWWMEQRDQYAPRGRRMIEAELRQRGVPREVIEALREGEEPEGASPGASEKERAARALERHLRGRPMPPDPRAVQRIGAFLVRRGFDIETVRAALRARQEPG